MNHQVIDSKNISFKVNVNDWKDAMQKSAQLLIDSNYVTQAYVDLTIKVVEEYGPYIVIAPGIALSHARPDVSVLKTGLSLITLSNPVNFNSENDPVEIVLTLAAKDDSEHLNMLQQLCCYLSEEDKLQFIKECTCAETLAKEINEFKIEM